MEYSRFNSIIDELRQIHKLHKKLMLQYCGDVTPEQGKLLFIIFKEKKMSQRELAKALHITEATLSVRIKRLIDTGLIERVVDEHDKRVYQIVLSQKGLDFMGSMKEKFLHYQDQMCKGITDEEFHTISNVIKKMKKNIEEEIEC